MKAVGRTLISHGYAATCVYIQSQWYLYIWFVDSKKTLGKAIVLRYQAVCSVLPDFRYDDGLTEGLSHVYQGLETMV